MGTDVVGKRGPDHAGSPGPECCLVNLTQPYTQPASSNQPEYEYLSIQPPLPFAILTSSLPMKYSPLDRSASLATAFIGAVSNVALAVYLVGLWRSLSWEPGSEWEGLRFSLSRDGASLICGLFSAYFAAASAICVFGLVGISKVLSSLFLRTCPRDTLHSAYPRLFAYTATMSLATLPFALSLPSWHLPQQ